MSNPRRFTENVWFVPALLVLLAAGVTPVFWLTDLDLRVAGIFYDQGGPNRGWWATEVLWVRVFYRSAPVIVGGLLAAALAYLFIAERRKRAGREWLRARRSGLLLALSLILGPGLLVNAVFKNHWGRPRPNHVLEFGGTERYLPPLFKGEPGKGKSFPSGHASVCFALAAVLPLWRRRRPRLAWTGFAISTLAGAGMGMARIAAGGHFLSDVIWSAIMCWFTVWFVYFFLVRRCAETTEADLVTESGGPNRARRFKRMLGVGLGVAVAGLLAATPVRRESRFKWPEQQPVPGSILIVAPGATVTVARPGEGTHPRMQIRQTLQGFGLPGNRLKVRTEADGAGGRWRYEGRPKGLFTEIKNTVLVTVEPEMAAALSIEVGAEGKVVFDCTDLAGLVKTDVHARVTPADAAE